MHLGYNLAHKAQQVTEKKYETGLKGLPWDFMIDFHHMTIIFDFCLLHIWGFVNHENRNWQLLILTH